MLSFYVALAYTIVNPILAVIILFKSRRNQLSKLYFFCVLSLSLLGGIGYVLGSPPPGAPVRALEQITAFLYSLFPFFFLHFMLIFVRRYEILNSPFLILATYFVGFFCYVLVLVKLIPNPFASGPTASGYVYYLTWMSILFSIGVALMYSLIGGFGERGIRSNALFVAFAFLMLLLPTPFTQSLFSAISNDSIVLYFTTSIAALAVLVYIVFRHRIVMNMPYQAMKTALEAMNDILLKTDMDFHIKMAQGATLSLLGYKEKELLDKNIETIIHNDSRLSSFRDQVLQNKASATSFEAEVECRDGKRLQMDFSFTPVFANEEIAGFVGVGRNITEKKRLEAQLRQAQKMEILGTLAGGVAHDFNNLLTIILANSSIINVFKSEPEKMERAIVAIKSAVHRGAGIASQLLTFARRNEVSFETTDANKVVRDTVNIMSATFPKSVTVSMSLSSLIPPILADVNQLSQAILNLCVNAKDALLTMEGSKAGGTITVATRSIENQALQTRFADAKAGRYVEISVTDNGVGMDEATKARIFEPFFTTKGPEKGTGLGLAVVYGVMKSHHGFVDVRSTLGKGTTFSLYFPVKSGATQVAEKVPEILAEDQQGHGETILVVEDEVMLLDSLRAALEEKGYRVLTAGDGAEAMRIFSEHVTDVALALLDIDLPKINGIEVHNLMRSVNRNLKTVFCTGSADSSEQGKLKDIGTNGIVPKPYSLEDISRTIAQVLHTTPRKDEKASV